MSEDLQAQTTPDTRPTTTVETKPSWESKTMWLNVCGAVVILIPTLSGMLPPSAAPWLGLGLAVANMVMRLISTGSVTIK